MKKKIYLITGFLGAGKTTVLNNIINSRTCKVGILMNEFGKVSMDTVAVSREGMMLKELTNGSIFCSCLKDHFISGLADMLKMDLQEIYIESSGLADPSDMGKVIRVIRELNPEQEFEFGGTICIVDGLFFEKELEKMVSVRKQIKHSHHVLINKIDLIDENTLTKIVDIIRTINPLADITPISFGNVDWNTLKINFFDIEDEESSNTIESKPKVLTLTFIKEMDQKSVQDFLMEIKSHFFRAKGYLAVNNVTYKIDLVNDRISWQEVEDIKLNGYDEKKNTLVLMTSKGLESISVLAKQADIYIKGCYTLKM